MNSNACGKKMANQEIFSIVKSILETTERYKYLVKSLHDDVKNLIESLPSNFIIDETNLTYIDKNFPSAKPHPISNLASPKTSFYKSLNQTQRTLVESLVNYAGNAKRRLKNEFSDDEIKEIAGGMESAFNSRSPELVEMASHVVGEYYNIFHGTKFADVQIVMTCNPIDIFMKSTAQSWESQSCERYGGQYFNGVFSDIQNVALIAFLRLKDEMPFARIMIRPCKVTMTFKESRGKTREEIDAMRQWAYGIEKYYYSKNDKTLRRSKYFIESIIPAFVATNAIERILKDAKVFDYNEPRECITPYSYEGYSDVMGSGHTQIRYTKYLSRCESCGDLLSTSIMEGGLCPSCYEEENG